MYNCCDLQYALRFPYFTFFRGMTFLSLEVFTTHLLDLRQPLSNVARKRSTEGVRLCKGIQVCRQDFQSPRED